MEMTLLNTPDTAQKLQTTVGELRLKNVTFYYCQIMGSTVLSDIQEQKQHSHHKMPLAFFYDRRNGNLTV